MNTQEQERSLMIQPRRALYIFGGAGIVMVILSFASQYLRLYPDSYNIRYPVQASFINDFILEFNFAGQPDIAIYHNILLLDAAACLLFVIAYLKNAVKDAYRSRWTAMAWIILFFAVDNMAVFHRRIPLLFQGTTVMGFKYAWMIAGIAGIVIFSVLFFRFWLHLDNKFRNLFLVSIVLYLAGAFGKEITGARAVMDLTNSLFLTAEQAFQYGGATLLTYSLLLYLTSFFPRFFVATKD